MNEGQYQERMNDEPATAKYSPADINTIMNEFWLQRAVNPGGHVVRLYALALPCLTRALCPGEERERERPLVVWGGMMPPPALPVRRPSLILPDHEPVGLKSEVRTFRFKVHYILSYSSSISSPMLVI